MDAASLAGSAGTVNSGEGAEEERLKGIFLNNKKERVLVINN